MKNTITRTGFLVIAIESIWANPSGGDYNTTEPQPSVSVPVGNSDKERVVDYDIKGEDITHLSFDGGDGEKMENGYSTRDSSQPYLKGKGYYKIIPFNYLSMDSTVSTSSQGSNFNLTFTLDDLIMVTENNQNNPFLGASGYIGNTNDIMDPMDWKQIQSGAGEFFDIFSYLKASGRALGDESFGSSSYAGAEYVNYYDADSGDSRLKLARWKITGAQSLFSLDDIVSPMDTVSVWMYHDPSDFYHMTDVKPTDEGLGRGADTEHILRDMSFVFGTLDRQQQFKQNDRNVNFDLLQNLGLSNKYIANSLSNSGITDQAKQNPITSYIENSTFKEIHEMALSFYGAAKAYDADNNLVQGDSSVSRLSSTQMMAARAYTIDAFGLSSKTWDIFESPISYAPPKAKIPTNLPEKKRKAVLTVIEGKSGTISGQESIQIFADPQRDEEIYGSSIAPTAIVFQNLDKNFRDLMYFLSVNYVLKPYIAQMIERNPGAASPTEVALSLTPDFLAAAKVTFENDQYISGYSIFKKLLDKYSQEKATYYESNLDRQLDGSIDNQYKSMASRVDRKILRTDKHGETPYMIFKGHVKDITTSINPKGGHIVKISGGGLDYPIEKHVLYFDRGMLGYGTSSQYLANTFEFTAVNPAQAIINLIYKHMPKTIHFGKKGRNDSLLEMRSNIKNVNYAILGASVGVSSKSDDIILKRGTIVFDSFAYSKDQQKNKEGKLGDSDIKHARIFTPIHFMNSYRLNEFLRAIQIGDKENVMVFAVNPNSVAESSIKENMETFAGDKRLYELFFDETGKIRYRIAAEAWERPSRPEHTPYVEDDMVMDATFRLTDEALTTMTEVVPTNSNLVGGGTGMTQNSQYSTGRALPPSGILPLKKTDSTKFFYDFSKNVIPNLFKYGLRTATIQDPYGVYADVAHVKAETVQRFFGEPMKTAQITVVGDPTYRAGDTVLVRLKKNVRRKSKKVINIQNYINWITNILKEEGEVITNARDTFPAMTTLGLFASADRRYFLNNTFLVNQQPVDTNRFYFIKKQGGEDGSLVQDWESDPEKFILIQVKKTLVWLKSIGLSYITPEYFPTNIWAYLDSSSQPLGGSISVGGNEFTFREILDMHRAALIIATNTPTTKKDKKTDFERPDHGQDRRETRYGPDPAKTEAASSEGELIAKYMKIAPEIVLSLAFQDHICQQYYITSVTQRFSHGSSGQVSTVLNLTYGQDVLAITDPYMGIVMGYISAERKLKFYDNTDLTTIRNEKGSNTWLTVIRQQWIEDAKYKDASFMHRGGEFRNASNFFHRLYTAQEG